MNPTLVRDDMRYWRMQPDARLRPWIVCYYIVEPASVGAPPAGAPLRVEQQLLIPDGQSELVFMLDANFARWPLTEPAKSVPMRASYLIGGRSHSVLTRNLGRVRLAGVKLDPRVLRALIDASLAEFRDSTLSFADLNRRDLLDLEDAVGNARSADEVGQVLDRFFLHALRTARIEEPAMDALLASVHRCRGVLSLMTWMREQGVDPRTLERRFCASMGVTPKQYARIIRFRHSYHRLMLSGARPGSLGAHLDGYYDESHFHREFRAFLGVSPSARMSGGILQKTTVSDHLLETELAADSA